MDLSFSETDKVFRDQVRDFLDLKLDDELRAGARLATSVFTHPDIAMRWQSILHTQGWAAPSWPVEWGGTGWSVVQKYIFSTECQVVGAPGLIPMSLNMCGPMLMGCASEEQKKYYLPRILSGEDFWCQGYSEPGAGSDLASLKLRADSDGEDYVLNGTKIWTSMAHYANKMFLLVRTDFDSKPQAGITFLLLDMNSSGIEVQPIVSISGDHELNQVFFTDVRVPKSQRVGEENAGWTVAKYLLMFERGGSSAPRVKRTIEELRKVLKKTDVPGLQSKVDEAEIGVMAIEATELRVMATLSNGGSPGPESSMLKTQATEMQQRLTELTLEAWAYAALPDQKSARTLGSNVKPLAEHGAMLAMPHYLNTRAASIYGGSNQVQRNIIAKQVLGL